MAVKSGRNCKVTLGASTIVGMGQWQIGGISADRIETSTFGTVWKSFTLGMIDGGTITFSGNADFDDITGQDVLKAANLNNTEITNLRLYIDNTSYYEPCQSSGYFTPTDSTGNDSVLSHVTVESYDITADKGDVVKTSFTAKVSGCMVLI